MRPFLWGLQGTKATIESAIIDALEAACRIERPTLERHAQQLPYDRQRSRAGNGAGHTGDTRNSRALISIHYSHSIRLARRHIHLGNRKA